MLFLLKRRWQTALAAALILAAVALGLRVLTGDGAPFGITLDHALLGLAVVAGVVASDLAIHGLLWLAWGPAYRARYLELTGVFRAQTPAAMLAGALMAGIGEEAFFRGVSAAPGVLAGGAVMFGLLHHVRRPLWPFTVWAVWQGALFAVALWWTQALCVTMVAHFCHDLGGFLVFRRINQAGKIA